jgi:two-component system cell cycle response regulator DivK
MTAARILVVDDNPINIELATHVLEQDGFVVAGAEDAVAAMTSIENFQPDLILMDIQMPGMDGLQLAQRLKRDPATWHVVIIAFTAYAMKGDEAKMRAGGCDGYIAKPLDVATFAQYVRAHLRTCERTGGLVR